jgi:hypothetical protein
MGLAKPILDYGSGRATAWLRRRFGISGRAANYRKFARVTLVPHQGLALRSRGSSQLPALVKPAQNQT